MNTLLYTRFSTQFCEIILVGNKRGLSHLHLNTGEGKRQFSVHPDWERDDTFFAEAKSQISEYLAGTRTEFTLSLTPEGTDFQKKVWEALRTIPYGKIISYGELAKKIGNPKSARAVGAANGKNPLPLIIPCHRVIGANGKLTGFAHGLKIKQQLITLENGITEFPA